MSDTPRITTEVKGHLFLIGLNRPDKLNAFDLKMLTELAQAYTAYEESPALRCAVVFAHGKGFTAGLDLANVGPAAQTGESLFPSDLVDPLSLHGRIRTKPVVMAVHGWCLTIGIEMMLASDIRIASENTRFGQIEIKRGIFPFGGATFRWPAVSGWGNAMRYLLTGDTLDAPEALRIGLVQEVTPEGQQLERAIALAETIAAQAPLGVQATLASARIARDQGPHAAATALPSQTVALFKTQDAQEGVSSFVERREARFQGN